MFNFFKKLFKKSDGLVETVGTRELHEHSEVPVDHDNIESIDIVEEEHIALESTSHLFKKNCTPMNKGKVCINNGTTKKFINKDDPIPEGWTLGGLKKNK